MIVEKSRFGKQDGREQTSWPTPERELTLRHVLPWPAAETQTRGNWPDVVSPSQPAAAGRERPAPRSVRIEIVIGAAQVPLLAELLRAISLTRPGGPGAPTSKQTGALPAATLFDLTPREEEVLEQMIAGKSNRQIALELEIATATVKCHVSNVLSKMGAESRTEAVAMALQR